MIKIDKKLFNLMVMLVITAMFALAGCDESSTDPDVDPLVGTWEWASVTVYYGTSIAAPDSTSEDSGSDDTTVITFNDDGTGTIVDIYDGETETTTFTYTATATVISMVMGTDSMAIPYEISGSSMTFTFHDEADEYDPEMWQVSYFTRQ